MFEKLLKGIKNWFFETIQNLKIAVKTVLINVILFIFYIIPIGIIYFILKENMPSFGFFSFIGGLFFYVAFIGLVGLIGTLHQVTVRNFVRNTRNNQREYKYPSFSEIRQFTSTCLLFIISGTLLIVLEILIKSIQI